jgi:hypothetical protein
MQLIAELDIYPLPATCNTADIGHMRQDKALCKDPGTSEAKFRERVGVLNPHKEHSTDCMDLD